MKRALYLDDERTPTETIPGYHPWEVVRSYQEFTDWIEKNGVPDLISFDHDLAEEHMQDYWTQVAQGGFQLPDYASYREKTGLDCAAWLCKHVEQHQLELRYCQVHSHNPVGATNIQSYINGFKKHMGWLQDCYLAKPKFTIKKKEDAV